MARRGGEPRCVLGTSSWSCIIECFSHPRARSAEGQSMDKLQLWGAACFGAIIGWYVYFLNRYRTGNVSVNDLTALVGVIGGSAILALFPERSALFGAYGIGLAVGF